MYRLETASGGIPKVSKRSGFFFFFPDNKFKRKMCCFFACLKNKSITNGLEKEFSTWEVEAMYPNVVRVPAFQMS